MELKNYQKDVISDLTRFIELAAETGDPAKSFKAFWNEKKVVVEIGKMKPYADNIPGVPNVCVKVPTGGGKTFIACNALKPIFDSYDFLRWKAVVWLVPSDSILEQTQKTLTDGHHPYRQKINIDFSNCVEVYTKQQLLNGQNFTPDVISSQLSVFVLSYDSFRTSKKEGRKVYQENGNLAKFAKFFNDPKILLTDTDETALIQVIRHLNPVVIVDESHHATSDLSAEMLKNLNPSFVLDLTATPKKSSNIVSYVDAIRLKAENMVKLPVIVYNRKTKSDVYEDAIRIRDKLERQAKLEQKQNGRYIRPIVLFQAQPRGSDDSTTFEDIKAKLLDIGISKEQIAIKTANVNDLRGVDLMSAHCPIRYIITVNALKEGWDCPFAYVLATIANRTSTVDVEQILGRILRLPYTNKSGSDLLNISYVITSSNDFKNTLEHVVAGLNSAGFTEKEFRAEDSGEAPVFEPESTSETDQLCLTDPQDIPPGDDVDTSAIRERLAEQPADEDTESIVKDELLSKAIQQTKAYNAALTAADASDIELAPMEVREMMNVFGMNEKFAEEALALRIPQFVVASPPSLFSSSETALLTQERLYEGFSLREQDIIIDFSAVDAEIGQVDLDEDSGATPKMRVLSGAENQYLKEVFASKPIPQRIKICKDIILSRLTKINAINDRDLKEYISRVVGRLDAEQLEDLQRSPYLYSDKIKRKIESLLALHAKKTFNLWIEQGKITCEQRYSLKQKISPTRFTTAFAGSLYKAEEEMNDLEKDVVLVLSSLHNIKWWHRNISKTGFCINGYVNAYPDLIVMTDSGRILMIEPKGDHLENSESMNKLEIGERWKNTAGDKYRYYMVFRNKDISNNCAVKLDRLKELLSAL